MPERFGAFMVLLCPQCAPKMAPWARRVRRPSVLDLYLTM
jgi:hypothetical protein